MTVNQSETGTSVMERSKSYARRVWITVAIAAAVLVALFITWYALEVLLALFAGILLAILLYGVSRFIAAHTPLSRKIAFFIILVLIVAALVLILFWAAPTIDKQANALGAQLSDSWDTLRTLLQQSTLGRMLLGFVPGAPGSGGSSGLTSRLFTRVGNVFSAAFDTVTKLVMILFVGLYLAYEPSLYINGMVKLAPQEHRERFRQLIAETVYALERWLIGQFVAMAIIGVLATVGLMLLGMPLALLLGLLAGMLEFIPLLGSIVASVIPVLLALTMSPQAALYVLLLFVAIQSLEGYLITPLVQKKAVKLPPALLLATQIFLGLFGGLFGVMVAAPLTVTAIVVVKMLYVEDILDDHSVAYLSASGDEEERQEEEPHERGAPASVAP